MNCRLSNISWLSGITIPLLIIFFSGHARAQHDEILALEDSLSVVENDSQRVDLLNELARRYMAFDIVKANRLLYQADSLAVAIGYKRGIANTQINLGRLNAYLSEYEKALDYFGKALAYYDGNLHSRRDSIEIAELYRQLGILNQYHDNLKGARLYYKRAINLYRILQDRKGEAIVLNNIGTLFLTNKKGQGNADSAFYYFDQARLLNLEIKNERHLSANYSNLGYSFAMRGDHKTAIEYYSKALEVAIKHDDKDGVAVSLNNIGDGYMNLGELDKADSFIRESMRINNEEGLKDNLYTNYYTLGEIYEKKGEYKKSLDWYKQANQIRESIYRPGNWSILMDIQNDQLKRIQQREIEQLNAINAEKVKTERFKKILFLSIAIFTLLLLLGITYFFMKRHKASLKIEMQSREILAQKEQIEEQAKKIRQVNKTLRERNKKLREMNEERIYMMSVVAHDLKSPLNQINGLVNVIKLEDESLTDTQRECLDNISVVSQRLSDLINKILGSRLYDKKKDDIEVEPVNIEEVAENSINDFKEVAAAKDITINLSIPGQDTLVQADRHYLRQIIDNLVSNAIKFSPAGSKVDVNIVVEGDKVQLEVADEGPGLTKEDKEKLFTEYAVLSAKPTGGESSTGLGLAIVKNYVEKLGGEIWCESEAGQGAAFKVRFDKA